MASLIKQNGAQTEPSRHGAIHISSAVSGIITNRFAFADPSTIVGQRFYGGRQDVILSGSNIEILSQNTWGRRYGTSPYTTFQFPTPPLGGFAYNSNGVFTVYVDTATGIYLVTPTSGTLIYTKSAGATQCNYLQLGTTLFVTDGVDNIKILNGTVYNWGVAAPTAAPTLSTVESAAAVIPWTALTVFSTMGLLVDANNNMEQLVQIPAPAGATYPNTQLGSTGSAEPNWNQTLLATTTEASGTPIVWKNLGAIGLWQASTTYSDSSNTGAASFAAAIYDPVSKAVYVQVGGATAGVVSGTVKPPFNGSATSSYHDNQCTWYFLGTFAQLGAWKSGTGYTNWYAPTRTAANVAIEPAILPPPSNQSVYLQVPTNTGTSGTATAPRWSTTTGAQTRDGNLLWLNLGSSNWAANHTYTAWQMSGKVFSAIQDSNNNFQVCITGGKSGGSAPTWNSGYGATTQDGTATWVCVGAAGPAWAVSTQWFLPPVAGFLPPQPGVSYGGATIVDSNTRSQYVTVSGKSGASAPSWSGIGNTTVDSGITWYCTAAYVQPNNTWSVGYGYGYAFKSRTATDFYVTNVPNGLLIPNGVPTGSADGSISSCSPLFKMPSSLTAKLTNISESSGSVVSVTAVNSFQAGASVSFAGLTHATWLNGQICTVSSTGLSSTGYQVNDPTLHGALGSTPETGVATASNSNLGAVNVLNGVGSTDAQIDTVVLFRSTDGFQTGGPYLEAVEFPAPPPIGGVAQPWQYLDFQPDTALNNLVEADTVGLNGPPPAGLQTLAYHQGRVWSHVNSIVYASSGGDIPPDNGNGLTGFGSANKYPLTSPITKLVAPLTGLMAFTTTDEWTIIGGPSISQYFPSITRPGVGLASKNAIITQGGEIMLFTSDRRLVALIPGQGETEPGQGINDQFVNYDPSKVYLTLHENGNDQAVYLSDGSTGYWRLVPHLWPNMEPCWSPFATINGGLQMLQSIQTGASTRTLLMGSPSNNQVLSQRDLTTWADNGVAYAANFVITIPVCIDGELVELDFISTTGPRVGSAPIVSYILNETSGTWQQFATYVNDPPSLYGTTVVPVTVYRNRYHFRQTMANGQQPQPIWCTDLLLNFAFPAENAQNEIARFTVFGQVWNDAEV